MPAAPLPQMMAADRALGAVARASGAGRFHRSDPESKHIRLGHYRVLYELNDSARVVRIMLVRHRREAYR